MKKYFQQGQPTVANKASVIHFDLDVIFTCREQMELFVRFLAEETYTPDFSVEYTMGDGATPDSWVVTVSDGAWAHNLKRFAKYLEKIDYNDEVGE